MPAKRKSTANTDPANTDGAEAAAPEPAKPAAPEAAPDADVDPADPDAEPVPMNRAERRARGKGRQPAQPFGRGKVGGSHGPAHTQRNWANRRSGG
jgi:hypothetical protein